MDLEKLSDAELEAIVRGGKPPAAMEDMSDEELEAIASGKPLPVAVPPGSPTAGDIASYVGSLIVEPAKQAGLTLSAPLAAMGKVTGAPLMAGAGALQRGEGLGGAADALVEQAKAGLDGEVLPTTPTGPEFIQAGLEQKGIPPELAAVPATVMGLGVEGVLDATNLIPGAGATKMARGMAKAGGKAASLAGKAVSPIASLAAKAEGAAARGIAHTGSWMTGGVLDAEKAVRMYKQLSAAEMAFPGNMKRGALSQQGSLLGQMREAFRAEQITVPGSHDAAMNIQKMVADVEARGFRTPGSERVLQKIKDTAFQTEVVMDPPSQTVMQNAVGADVLVDVPAQAREVMKPRDLTLDEIDDLVRMFDDIGYTPLGNPRSMPAVWGPTVAKSRRLADEVLQTVPEGQLFKAEKTRFEALATAGRERSKLFEAGADMGKAAAIITKNPVALVTEFITPGAYVNMLAALKVPRHIASGAVQAKNAGGVAIREFLTTLAEKEPFWAERMVRATVLLSNKRLNQALTPEEVGSLAAHRVFDEEQVAAEKARIQSDPDMDSKTKAKRLSDINKNGYFIVEAPVKLEPEQTPTDQVFGGPDGLRNLMQSLERAGGT